MASVKHLPIFVYGTLQRGEVRHKCWPHQPLRIDDATTRGRLYDLGPYPALIRGEDLVLGELWHLAADHLPETLQALDEIECYGHDDVDLYVRRIVQCRTLDGTECLAYAYFFADEKLLKDAALVHPDERGFCSWRRNHRQTSARPEPKTDLR